MPKLVSARMLYVVEMALLGVPSMFLLGRSGLGVGWEFIAKAAQPGMRFPGPGELAFFVFMLGVCLSGLVALAMLARVSWIYLSRGCAAIAPAHIFIGVCLAFLPFMFNAILVSLAVPANGFAGVAYCLYATGLVLAAPIFHLSVATVHASDMASDR